MFREALRRSARFRQASSEANSSSVPRSAARRGAGRLVHHTNLHTRHDLVQGDRSHDDALAGDDFQHPVQGESHHRVVHGSTANSKSVHSCASLTYAPGPVAQRNDAELDALVRGVGERSRVGTSGASMRLEAEIRRGGAGAGLLCVGVDVLAIADFGSMGEAGVCEQYIALRRPIDTPVSIVKYHVHDTTLPRVMRAWASS